MKTRIRVAIRWGCAVGVMAAWVAAPAAAAAESIGERVGAAVRASGLGRTSSVVVYDVEDQQIVYNHRERASSTPASNQKLYTAAAALKALGPNHRFQTTVALQGTQTGTRFVGTVYLIGGGDPTLSTPTFGRRNYGGEASNLDLLTLPLRQRGIRSIRGDLVVDESFLDTRRYVVSWPGYFRYDETTALGALAVNQSYLGTKLWGRSSREPAMRAGKVFVDLMRAHDVRIRGTIRPGRTPKSAERLGVVESPPLSSIVAFMGRRSDNYTAEILLKDLGRIKRGAGSTDAGVLAARQALSELGLDLAGVALVDGSGLSSSNRTYARNIADLLNILDKDADLRDEWLDGLAVSGRSGTLRERLEDRPYRGRVRAKTGTLNSSSALSGYATRAGTGERYGFAVVTYAGGRRISTTAARRLQDRVARILVR